uniref:Tyrosine specific protein phosphatases domain-containing protein n=1 Tax=Panagrolaimus sp. JU765 TaxID=591449 RepID=A0AC34RSP9_9BILA
MNDDDSPKRFKRRKVVNTNQNLQNGERKINENGLPREQAMSAGLPARWMYCPKYGQVIENLFFPMKTPLSEGYDDLLETQYRFHPEDVFKIEHPNNLKPKIWISLANTERFYGRKQVTNHDCEYIHLPMQVTNHDCEYIHLPMVGHDEAPTVDDVKRFLRIANGFYNKNEPGLIVLHCTHGFNRTGFLIAAALVELFGYDPEAALLQFASARPHGIYKEDYLR